jgi:hypothetical protein
MGASANDSVLRNEWVDSELKPGFVSVPWETPMANELTAVTTASPSKGNNLFFIFNDVWFGL